jgi:DNA polymerase IIIc chi subunit
VVDIIRDLLVRAEDEARRQVLAHDLWARQDHQRRIFEAERMAKHAEATRVAREKAAAEARIEALLSGADALERAARIRRYVAAVRAATQERPAAAGVDRWAAWALEQADLIDPVVSNAFLRNLEI